MITLDLETFQQSREGGNVTGVMYLDLESGEFPERDWSDFPATILGWWTDAWLELEEPTRRSVQWQFMEGPYAAILEKALASASPDTFENSHIRNSLLEAAESVLNYCVRHNIPNEHFELLRTNVQRLKAITTDQRTEASRVVFIGIRTSLATGFRR